MDKILTITLKTEDIKIDHTVSGRLIDKLAITIGERTEDDLWENNIDFGDDNQNYILNNYNYHDNLLAYLNRAKTPEQAEKIMVLFDESNLVPYNHYNKQPLAFGAFLAINYPVVFTRLLKKYTDKIKELAIDHNDIELEALAPGLAKELNDAEVQQQKELYKEWLYGDRSNNGIVESIRKYFHAEEVDYNEATDQLTLTLSESEAKDFLNLLDEDKLTKKECKALIIDHINNTQQYKHEKQHIEAKARNERYKEQQTYKDKQRKEAEQARLDKLNSMLK